MNAVPPVHVPLRLCLDLNVWCAHYWSIENGRSGRTSHFLVEVIRTGTCSLGTVQLIISWGMLNRLRQVLETKFEASQHKIDQYLDVIVGYAQLQEALGPSLTLGGTGLVPIRDEEDAHVIDTAIAGDADILVTANFRDFLPRHVEILTPGRLARIAHPKGHLLIAHLYTARDWLSSGSILLP